MHPLLQNVLLHIVRGFGLASVLSVGQLWRLEKVLSKLDHGFRQHNRFIYILTTIDDQDADEILEEVYKVTAILSIIFVKIGLYSSFEFFTVFCVHLDYSTYS